MESQFKELKEMVNTTLSERKGQDDALELAKTRGEYAFTVGVQTLTVL
jgi:kinesin family protein C1